jgi:general secretion pathway protein G
MLLVNPVLRQSRRAFSLIEIMIVLVIIAIMAGAVTMTVSHRIDMARKTRAKSDITEFITAIESFYSESGRYPTNEEGLAILAPKYIKAVVKDPWGRAYQYNRPGKTSAFEVICYGADGRNGGTAADEDITSDNLDKQDKQETPAK